MTTVQSFQQVPALEMRSSQPVPLRRTVVTAAQILERRTGFHTMSLRPASPNHRWSVPPPADERRLARFSIMIGDTVRTAATRSKTWAAGQ
jgi:hypothetical protein